MALTANQTIRHSATQSADTHESVLDMVVDTAPMQVPLMAMANRGTNPLHTTHEWVLDYSAPYPTALTGLVRGVCLIRKSWLTPSESTVNLTIKRRNTLAWWLETTTTC